MLQVQKKIVDQQGHSGATLNAWMKQKAGAYKTTIGTIFVVVFSILILVGVKDKCANK